MKRATVIACSTITALCICLSVTAVAQKAEKTDLDVKRETWQTNLRQAFKDVSAAIAIDIDLNSSPLNTVYKPIYTEQEYVDLVAAFISREAKPLTNGWSLIRSAKTSAGNVAMYRKLSAWLNQAPDEEIQKLCKTGVSFNELSPASKLFVASQCHEPALQKKMSEGQDTVVSLRLSPVARFKDKNGNSEFSIVDPFRRDSESEMAIQKKVSEAAKPPVPKTDQKVQLSGALDFSDGQLLSLSEVITKANEAFKKTYAYDARLKDSYYYWQGRFDEKSFLEYLKTVIKPIEPEDLQKSLKDLHDLYRNTLQYKLGPLFDDSALLKGITGADLFGGKQLSGSDLAAIYPGWKDVVSIYGLGPDTPVTFSPGLEMIVVGPAGKNGSVEETFGPRWSIVYQTIKGN